jgi:hypothetical protein
MRHLDAELYGQIRDQPERVAGETYQHLREECPECAAFLASLPVEQRDDRIRRLIREPDAAPLSAFSLRPGDGSGPRLIAVALGIVGMVVAAGLVEAYFIHRTTIGPRPIMANVPPVQIQVTVRHRDGTEVVAGADDELASTDTLHAHALLERNAYVSLVRAGDNAGFEPIVLNQLARTATVEFATDGGEAAIPLENLNGSQHLLALTCDRPIAIDEAISAAKQILPAGLGMAVYSFRVAPVGNH